MDNKASQYMNMWRESELEHKGIVMYYDVWKVHTVIDTHNPNTHACAVVHAQSVGFSGHSHSLLCTVYIYRVLKEQQISRGLWQHLLVLATRRQFL